MWIIFGIWNIEKIHTAVEGKQISNSKYINYIIFRSFLEVAMLSKYTPLWHEVHFEIKMYKTYQFPYRCDIKYISKLKYMKFTTFRSILVIQSSFRVVGQRDCAPCQKWAKWEDFIIFPKLIINMGYLERFCKDIFSVIDIVLKIYL